VVVLSVACESEERFEAISLLGDTLVAPTPAPAVRARYDSLLGHARAAYDRTPDDLDSIIWFGRRTAYLGRYQEAIAIFSRGLEVHPDHPWLLRHRGHRWISVRQLGHAVEDLSRAAQLVEGQPDQVEPDGLPNAAGIPTSTLHTNIYYHLGLAQYLRGAYAEARGAYERGLAASTNPDMTVAFQYWMVLTARRLDDTVAVRTLLAGVDPHLQVIENTTYHRLLLHFRGLLPADSLMPNDSLGSLDNVTAAYGVAAWHLLNGRPGVAGRMFTRIVQARDQWPSFGYIAAEAELAHAAMAHAH
jgi:tetratricopeptide (TPR) repeat protein